MLYNRAEFTELYAAQPVIVWLHGLLGSGDDWTDTRHLLPQYAHLLIDLPGHGGSQTVRCDSLAQCAHFVVETIKKRLGAAQPVILVGYSLGARIAMMIEASGAAQAINLQGLLLEGGNAGLDSQHARSERLAHDRQWAQRFANEPLERVLDDWYQQSVFGALHAEQRQCLVAERRHNCGATIAHMLMHTSLGTQRPMLTALQHSPRPIHYVCGEKDNKFQRLARGYGLPTSVIAGAGHNVHKEQPQQFAQLVQHFIATTKVGCSSSL